MKKLFSKMFALFCALAFVSLAPLAVSAQEGEELPTAEMPEPKPIKPGQENVEKIRTHGGALKVQKKPAKIEGLNAPAKKDKAHKHKKDSTETHTEESH